MSKDTHKPFVANYDPPNYTQVYTEGRHNAAMLKDNNSKTKTVNKYYALVACAALFFGTLSTFSDYTFIEKNTTLIADRDLVNNVFPTPGLASASTNINIAEIGEGISVNELNSRMQLVIDSNLDDLRAHSGFEMTPDFSLMNKDPAKIYYARNYLYDGDYALFGAIVTKKDSEGVVKNYIWYGIVKDGKLSQLDDLGAYEKIAEFENEQGESVLLNEEIETSDTVSNINFQKQLFSGLETARTMGSTRFVVNGKSFARDKLNMDLNAGLGTHPAVYVTSFNIVSDILTNLSLSKTSVDGLIPKETVSQGIHHIINGLNNTGEIPSGINYKTIGLEEFKTEGLIDIENMNYGQLKVIEIDDNAKLVFGTAVVKANSRLKEIFESKDGDRYPGVNLTASLVSNGKSKTLLEHMELKYGLKDRPSMFSGIFERDESGRWSFVSLDLFDYYYKDVLQKGNRSYTIETPKTVTYDGYRSDDFPWLKEFKGLTLYSGRTFNPEGFEVASLEDKYPELVTLFHNTYDVTTTEEGEAFTVYEGYSAGLSPVYSPELNDFSVIANKKNKQQ